MSGPQDFDQRAHSLWRMRLAHWQHRARYFWGMVLAMTGGGAVIAAQLILPAYTWPIAWQCLFARFLVAIGSVVGKGLTRLQLQRPRLKGFALPCAPLPQTPVDCPAVRRQVRHGHWPFLPTRTASPCRGQTGAMLRPLSRRRVVLRRFVIARRLTRTRQRTDRSDHQTGPGRASGAALRAISLTRLHKVPFGSPATKPLCRGSAPR
jgi:hypothetical protein